MRNAGSLRVRALRLLAARERSRAELRRKLADDDAEASEVEGVLDELQREGLLSETRLAEQLIHAARGRYGSRRVLERLRSRGLGGEALDRAEQALKVQELESARAVWRKRFDRLPGTLQEKARQARFLASRGFSNEVIHRILGRILGAAEEDQ
ncbi:MAG TPA: recombination regulator RecX [Burkholderiales bacterium]